ncbi:hypothetical protein A2V94_04845 [Candidatus Atribacteria bacterium RBG_16_35_8]|nr:MAG: hypothetical protein A2V94_04845 [Candidatus Atribacteria bacterium RBG_16_35_8]
MVSFYTKTLLYVNIKKEIKKEIKLFFNFVYMKDGRKERISIPVHSNKSIKKDLLKAILKLADIEIKR